MSRRITDSLIFTDAMNLFTNTNAMKMVWEKTQYPPCDIIVTDKTMTFVFAVAGFTKDEISVKMVDNIMVIAGKKTTKYDDATVFMHRGIGSRNFENKFPFKVTSKITSARLADGLLTVIVESDQVVSEVEIM